MAESRQHPRVGSKGDDLRTRRRKIKPDFVDPCKVEEEEKLRTNANADYAWTPNGFTAFKAILSARLCAAIWSNISDCDEVYNYWEPMHYIMHGSGFQTWEYSPMFAIRSYGYLWVHILPLKALAIFLNVSESQT